MELSGLIFVALALVWAVVLIPKALRHHEEVARTRAVEDVSDGVRVVARRTSTPPVEQAPTPQLSGAVPRSDTRAKGAGEPAGRAAARAAARRRRRVLLLLVLLALGVGTAAWFGYLLPWAPAIPVTLILGFLVLARVSVRRERARRARQATVVGRADDAVTAEADRTAADDGSPTVAAPDVAAPAVSEATTARDDKVLEIVSGLDDTSAYSLQFEPSEATAPANESVWDPLPVTLPTYVSKPRATRSVRTIDLGSPDVSSSGRDAAASALVAEAATSTTVTTGTPAGTEALGEDQRAVGS